MASERAKRGFGAPVAALAVMFSTVALVAGEPASAARAPSLTVAPAIGLEPGGQVAFVGSGFPPGVPVQVEECELPGGSPPDPSRCTPIADSLLLTGADGSVQGTVTVVTGPVGAGAGATCPPAPPAECAVSLVAAGAGGWWAEAPITFSPVVPPPAPALPPPTVAPASVARATPSAAGPATPPPIVVARPTPLRPPAAPRPARGGTSAWTFGLVALVVGSAAAGVGRARAGLRRARPA